VHASVHRQNRVVGREEQHALRASLAKLRKRLERAPGGGERTANRRGKSWRSTKEIDARLQRPKTLLSVRASERHCRFELRARNLPHCVRRERGNSLQRAKRGPGLLRCRMHR
jgi:hypothetical protein